MDGLSLLRKAHDAGLKVRADGEKLVINGPRRAEPVALLLLKNKPIVMAALAATDRPHNADWRRLYHQLVTMRRGVHYSEAEAQQLAWGEVTSRWHLQHGQRVPASHCAGCDGLIAGTSVLDLPDGCRVHFDGFDCITAYGEKWRGAAERALADIGLVRPPEIEP
jgi:hypothetical protein